MYSQIPSSVFWSKLQPSESMHSSTELWQTPACAVCHLIFLWLGHARPLQSEHFSLHTIYSTIRPAKVSVAALKEVSLLPEDIMMHDWAPKIKLQNGQMCQTVLKSLFLEWISDDLLLEDQQSHHICSHAHARLNLTDLCRSINWPLQAKVHLHELVQYISISIFKIF